MLDSKVGSPLGALMELIRWLWRLLKEFLQPTVGS